MAQGLSCVTELGLTGGPRLPPGWHPRRWQGAQTLAFEVRLSRFKSQVPSAEVWPGTAASRGFCGPQFPSVKWEMLPPHRSAVPCKRFSVLFCFLFFPRTRAFAWS